MRHAGVRLALPVAPLPVAMGVTAWLALLITAAGCAQLLPPDGVAARVAAIALPAITCGANEERCPAHRRAANSNAEGRFELLGGGAQSRIMPSGAIGKRCFPSLRPG